MQCYTQVIPPTAVTSSVSLPFLSSTANNLIVAKHSVLQIFALKSVVAEAPNDSNGSHASPSDRATPRRDRSHLTKLVLISEHHVAGTITALARISRLRSKSGGDVLLVSLENAKLSLMEWDPERYSISTVSIHYYERDDLQGAPWGPSLALGETYLSVDPSNRCAAFKFGARQLAILPLVRASGDDLAMDDYEMDAEPKSARRQLPAQTNGDAHGPTPHTASFVLSLLSLDPALTHPIHLAFLHEYREPTIGIVSSRVAPSSALLPARRDCVSYTVYTLDLEQRASTTLLSVQNLPYDIRRVVPLPLPVGGALLVGANELIHVDQAGKTNAVAVNGLAKLCSAFPMTGQDGLDAKLENCLVEQLGSSSGELLLFLRSGQLLLLRFRVEGRSVSELSVEKVPEPNGEPLLSGPASCTSPVGRGRLFVGSEESDSVILGWSTKQASGPRKPSDAGGDALEGLGADSDVDSLDDDDLYADSKPKKGPGKSQVVALADVRAADCVFTIHDRLINLSPLSNLTTTQFKASSSASGSPVATRPYDLLAVSGQHSASRIVRLSPNVPLQAHDQLEVMPSTRFWPLHVENLNADSIPEKGTDKHNVVVTSNNKNVGDGTSHVFILNQGGLQELAEGDFETGAGASVDVFTLLGGSRVVQVLPSEVRAFDGDFSLMQILPLSDENDNDIEIFACSVAEPFILLQRSDHRLTLLRVNDRGELEEIEDTGVLPSTRWKSGSLFDDVNDVFRLSLDGEGDDDDLLSVLMFLIDIRGGLQIFRLPGLAKPAYTAPSLSFLPGFLTPDFSVRRSNARDTLEEILITELGDSTFKALFMVLRSSNNDVTIYSPYHDSTKARSEAPLHFVKLPNQYLPEAPREGFTDNVEFQPKERLSSLTDLHGYSVVVMTGSVPCLILKTAATNPHVISLHGRNILDLNTFNASFCQHGLACLDTSNHLTVSQLPEGVELVAGWTVQTLFRGSGLALFDYHQFSDRLVVSTSTTVPFKLPVDDTHPEWANEDTTLLPEGEQDAVTLVDRSTWRITHQYTLDPDEVITCIKVMSLEVSEVTRRRRDMVVVGTATLKGEDLNAQGTTYVFDILEVVPEPDHPETDRKLVPFAKVKEKGAVTAISRIGSEGFIFVAQGQKCLVRGLREDNSLPPVAFIDVQCYTTVIKELQGTGLTLIADGAKGVWLTGYTEEPYSLRLFGKGLNNVPLVAAEFLPDGRALHILVADLEGVIHILDYDPHNPKSLTGQRILHLGSFDVGTSVSRMELVARPNTSWEQLRITSDPETAALDPPSPYQVLVASGTGALGLLTPLSAPQYRSLASLQAWLGTTALTHPLGLSPKARRNIDVDLSVGGRPILDGDVLARWNELGSWRRAEGVTRAGVDAEWELRAMLETISGKALGFL